MLGPAYERGALLRRGVAALARAGYRANGAQSDFA